MSHKSSVELFRKVGEWRDSLFGVVCGIRNSYILIFYLVRDLRHERVKIHHLLKRGETEKPASKNTRFSHDFIPFEAQWVSSLN